MPSKSARNNAGTFVVPLLKKLSNSFFISNNNHLINNSINIKQKRPNKKFLKTKIWTTSIIILLICFLFLNIVNAQSLASKFCYFFVI